MYESIFDEAVVHFACTGCQELSVASGDDPDAGKDAE